MEAEVVPGRLFRNLKTGGIYRVLHLERCSETLETRVAYEPVGGPWPASWEPRSDALPWSRPLVLFLVKFTPVVP